MAIEFDPKKILVVPIEQVRPNTWNPKDKETPEFNVIKEGIKIKGQRMPVIVRTASKSDDSKAIYEIVDGEQRWTAASELGFKDILIYDEGDISDQLAKELTLWYEQKVPFNNIELAYLVAQMASEYTNLELPYTEIQMEEFKNLANFNFDQYKEDGQAEDKSEAKTIHVVVTDLQYSVITQAINQVVEEDDCTEGQALERICIEFINSPAGTTGSDQI